METLARGDVVDATIEKGVYRGLGLARHQGQVIFVPRAAPGDRVRLEITETSAGYVRGRVLERLQDGPGRRPSPCPYVPRCGGCTYQELEPEAQLRLKEGILRECLERAGVRWEAPIPLAASPERAWRTRAAFHFATSPSGELRLGLHEEGTRKVVDLEHCLQLSEAANGAARSLVSALAKSPRPPKVRTLEIAESQDGSRLVLNLKTAARAGDVQRLAPLGEIPGVTGFGVETDRGVFVSLRGDPWVENSVQGVRIRAHVQSFFQGNRFLLEDLVSAATSALPRGGRVLDLYSGVGLFALAVAPRSLDVRGAESNPRAVEDARGNLERAGFTNVRIQAGDVQDLLATWPVEEGEHVVLDPPRTGAGGEVVRAVLSRNPASVVYVSCDPPTLGRDLRIFALGGYLPTEIRAFDLFPDTFHLETVVRLTRAETP
jgi:23S rRNA (uracil1939-C5)-methyltransferase